jgi:hypothetical protein
MGTTGISTGVHCHFETWGAGGTQHMNPRLYMAAAMAPEPAGELIEEEEEMAEAAYVIAVTDEGEFDGITMRPGNWILVSGSAFIVARSEEHLHAWANMLRVPFAELVSVDSRVTSRMTGRSAALLASDFRAEQREYVQLFVDAV